MIVDHWSYPRWEGLIKLGNKFRFVAEPLPLVLDEAPQVRSPLHYSAVVERTAHHHIIHAPPNVYDVQVRTLQGPWKQVDAATFQKVPDFESRVDWRQALL